MLTAVYTRLTATLLTLLGLSASPLVFGAPVAPATSRGLKEFFFWIQWQPLFLQAVVAISLVVAILLVLLLLAKVLPAYAPAFIPFGKRQRENDPRLG